MKQGGIFPVLLLTRPEALNIEFSSEQLFREPCKSSDPLGKGLPVNIGKG